MVDWLRVQGICHDLIVWFEFFSCHFGPVSSRESAAANIHSKKSLGNGADSVTGRAPLMSPAAARSCVDLDTEHDGEVLVLQAVELCAVLVAQLHL